jgi:hypothetical protein
MLIYVLLLILLNEFNIKKIHIIIKSAVFHCLSYLKYPNFHLLTTVVIYFILKNDGLTIYCKLYKIQWLWISSEVKIIPFKVIKILNICNIKFSKNDFYLTISEIQHVIFQWCYKLYVKKNNNFQCL